MGEVQAKLMEVRRFKVDEKGLRASLKYLKNFEKTNRFFWDWLSLYYRSIEQAMTSDDFQDSEDEEQAMQPPQPSGAPVEAGFEQPSGPGG